MSKPITVLAVWSLEECLSKHYFPHTARGLMVASFPWGVWGQARWCKAKCSTVHWRRSSLREMEYFLGLGCCLLQLSVCQLWWCWKKKNWILWGKMSGGMEVEEELTGQEDMLKNCRKSWCHQIKPKEDLVKRQQKQNNIKQKIPESKDWEAQSTDQFNQKSRR